MRVVKKLRRRGEKSAGGGGHSGGGVSERGAGERPAAPTSRRVCGQQDSRADAASRCFLEVEVDLRFHLGGCVPRAAGGPAQHAPRRQISGESGAAARVAKAEAGRACRRRRLFHRGSFARPKRERHTHRANRALADSTRTTTGSQGRQTRFRVPSRNSFSLFWCCVIYKTKTRPGQEAASIEAAQCLLFINPTTHKVSTSQPSDLQRPQRVLGASERPASIVTACTRRHARASSFTISTASQEALVRHCGAVRARARAAAAQTLATGHGARVLRRPCSAAGAD